VRPRHLVRLESGLPRLADLRIHRFDVLLSVVRAALVAITALLVSWQFPIVARRRPGLTRAPCRALTAPTTIEDAWIRSPSSFDPPHPMTS